MKNIILLLCLLAVSLRAFPAAAVRVLGVNDSTQHVITPAPVNNSPVMRSDDFSLWDACYIQKRTVASGIATASRYVSDVVFYDGLGRPLLESAIQASPTGLDISKLIFYDSLGRQDARVYLPYVSDVDPLADLISEQKSFYRSLFYAGDLDHTYAENVYEKTPMNRVVASWRPGQVFRDRGKKAENQYGINASGSVFNLVLRAGGVKASGYYDRGILRETASRNEDGQEIHIFTDSRGKTVLERHLSDDGPLDTYYVHDKFGDLRWVFPPEASARLADGTTIDMTLSWVRDYCYYYEYDTWRNLWIKKLPGSEEEYFVYDRAERIVLRQNGRMREGGKFLYSRYDGFGRVAEERLIPFSMEQENPKSRLTAQQQSQLETITGTLLASYTYDAYQGNHLWFRKNHGEVSLKDYDTNTKGYKTGEKLAILGSLDEDVVSYIERKFYYDELGRVIQTVEQNQAGETSIYSNIYDLVGNPLVQIESQTVARGVSTTIVRRNTYDARGRVVCEQTAVDGNECAKVSYQYDILGRPELTIFGNNTDTVRNIYNLRGDLVSRCNRNYTMCLYYEYTKKATPSYSGNVAEWEWRRGTEGLWLYYAFSYDKMGRLTGANLYGDAGSNVNYIYNKERGISYDKNGNILTLQRYRYFDWKMVADSLYYRYEGNRLKEVTNRAVNGLLPGSSVYQYDVLGNLVSESGRSLSYKYNILNLLSGVNNGSVTYRYAYDGTKLSAMDWRQNGYMYAGSCIFSSQMGTPRLESVNFSEGMIVSTSGTPETRYYVRDHLGSPRAIVGGNGQKNAELDYYPFGATVSSFYNVPPVGDRTRFNGKEEQRLLSSLGDQYHLDYGARLYDPLIGRWLTIDPLAEKYYSQSPYAYCVNNPVTFVDPDGKKIVFVNGYLGFGSFEGGKKYWSNSFIAGAQTFFNDNAKPYFTDVKHGIFSSASGRYREGYAYAKENYASLIAGMSQGETFKFVSHSMGGAFSIGLKEYLEEQGWNVESSIFINTYQSGDLKTVKDDPIFLIDYQNTNDPVLFWLDLNLGKGEIKNSDIKIRVKSDYNTEYIHKGPISSGENFWMNLQNILKTLHE